METGKSELDLEQQIYIFKKDLKETERKLSLGEAEEACKLLIHASRSLIKSMPAFKSIDITLDRNL